jgi:Protein of unknown function (DUF1194)
MAPNVRATAVKSSIPSRLMRASWRRIAAPLCRLVRGTASRALIVPLMILPAAAADRTLTNLELVLALDCSASVDSREFRIQIDGIAEAFKDPKIHRAVENLKPFGVAVSIVQWGAPGETKQVVPFTLLMDARDTKAFGFRASLIPRWLRASETSIATAIADSAELIESNAFEGRRKVIDVSGDGRDNSTLDLESARLAAKEAGITVNGLAIESDDGKLAAYFKDNVMTGADAFVERAENYEDFARAIREKLLRELTPLGS